MCIRPVVLILLHVYAVVPGDGRIAALKLADVMKAIRRMEPAWQKVQGGNFSLSHRTYELPNGGFKKVPCYSLTKTECLYIATKFNDEARARLVLRWQELEAAWERVNGRKFALVESRHRPRGRG